MQQSVAQATPQLRLSEILSALSFALDLTEGQPMGHSVRTCLLGMRLAEKIQLSPQERSELFYALLLKDSGCSSNAARMAQIFGADDRAAKRDFKTTDWTRLLDGFNYVRKTAKPGSTVFQRFSKVVELSLTGEKQLAELTQVRCDRGAQIARKMGFSEPVSAAIRSLDEHFDGNGYPEGLRGCDIPLFARIANLCQTLEVFATLEGPARACRMLRLRRGKWFDPELVDAALDFEHDETLWRQLEDETARETVLKLEPALEARHADDETLDNVCEAFAEVIDAKSPYTHRHSVGVAQAAVGMATYLGLPAQTVTLVRRAALLHDIGKLGVSNTILDKRGKLTAQELEVVRLHPYYTQRILERISSFQELAFVASSHHERMDGKGYYRNLRAEQLPLPARILAVADVYEALAAKRPYRDALPTETVLETMARDVPSAFCPECFEGLRQSVGG